MTKADFRAMREALGLTQLDVADACGVRALTVKRWERPGFPEPPEDAVEWLEGMADLHDEMVGQMVGLALASPADEIRITYFRDQAQYDASGRDDGPFGFANAVARDVAAELAREGVDVAFAYPDDGAVSTPGSRY